MSKLLDDFKAILDRSAAREEWLMDLVRQAVESDAEVLAGVWGPTGQRIFIRVEKIETPAA